MGFVEIVEVIVARLIVFYRVDLFPLGIDVWPEALVEVVDAVTTKKATARIKAENLLFGIRITVFTHLLPNILVLIRVIRQFW